MRSSACSTSSTGLTSPRRTAAAASSAVRSCSSHATRAQTAGATWTDVGAVQSRYCCQDGSRLAHPMTTATVAGGCTGGVAQAPAELGEQPVALAMVAAGARGDHVRPDVQPAARARPDVVDGVGPHPAVRAQRAPSRSSTARRVSGTSRRYGTRTKRDEPHHSGHLDGRPRGVHDRVAGLDDDGLLGQDEDDGAPQRHDAQRLVRRVEDERSATHS